jgi:hypothetical protein
MINKQNDAQLFPYLSFCHFRLTHPPSCIDVMCLPSPVPIRDRLCWSSGWDDTVTKSPSSLEHSHLLDHGCMEILISSAAILDDGMRLKYRVIIGSFVCTYCRGETPRGLSGLRPISWARDSNRALEKFTRTTAEVNNVNAN